MTRRPGRRRGPGGRRRPGCPAPPPRCGHRAPPAQARLRHGHVSVDVVRDRQPVEPGRREVAHERVLRVAEQRRLRLEQGVDAAPGGDVLALRELPVRRGAQPRGRDARGHGLGGGERMHEVDLGRHADALVPGGATLPVGTCHRDLSSRCDRSPTEHISHLERTIRILRRTFPRRPRACVLWTRCPRPCSPSAARSTTAACARRCVECPDGTSRTLPARLGPGRMLIERGSRRAPPPSLSGPRRAWPTLSVHEMTRQTTRSSPSGPTGHRKGRP